MLSLIEANVEEAEVYESIKRAEEDLVKKGLLVFAPCYGGKTL